MSLRFISVANLANKNNNNKILTLPFLLFARKTAFIQWVYCELHIIHRDPPSTPPLPQPVTTRSLSLSTLVRQADLLLSSFQLRLKRHTIPKTIWNYLHIHHANIWPLIAVIFCMLCMHLWHNCLLAIAHRNQVNSCILHKNWMRILPLSWR